MTTKILLVDDDHHVRNSGRQILELAGFSVTCCENAEQALKLVERDFSVLVTDLRMPRIDGLTLMERAHALDPDLPVLVVTGHGDVATAVRAIRSGAYDFIEKPFPSDLLVDTVRRAAEHRNLLRENQMLKEELAQADETTIIGRSPAIERMRKAIAAVADTSADVLVIGETGTGKEMVARALHRQSVRGAHKFVALNCGAMPENIFESELFGHEAGAFTGASKHRVGRIEFANRGTLFLDEIESMPLALQVKILRVLQERVVEPLGSNDLVPVDIRVVAATKVNLKTAAAEGKFREDLYYRLNVVLIAIPPLRERLEDLPLLFQHFVQKAAVRYGKEPPKLTFDVLHRLTSHNWPGNVRELKSAADRFVLGLGDCIEPLSPAAERPHRLGLVEQVDLFERSLIENELSQHQGNVKATIEALSIPRKTFYYKLHRYGLEAENYR